MDPDKNDCMCVAVYHDFWKELPNATMNDLFEEYESTIYKNHKDMDKEMLHRLFWDFVCSQFKYECAQRQKQYHTLRQQSFMSHFRFDNM